MNVENTVPQAVTVDDTRGFVRRQVERIIDSGEGDRRQVIVRVLGRDAEERLLADTAARAISQRNMCLSARDTLPSDRKLGKRSAAPQDQGFPRDNRGVSAQIPYDKLAKREVEALRQYAYEELKPLATDTRVANYVPPALAGIEPDMPRPTIKVTPGAPGQARSWKFEETPAAETATTDVVKDLKAWLADLLSTEPQWIPGSKVFVGSLDSGQLRRLMESPLVRAIHLNSRHVEKTRARTA